MNVKLSNSLLSNTQTMHPTNNPLSSKLTIKQTKTHIIKQTEKNMWRIYTQNNRRYIYQEADACKECKFNK